MPENLFTQIQQLLVFPAGPSAERGAKGDCISPQVSDTLALIGEILSGHAEQNSTSPAAVPR